MDFQLSDDQRAIQSAIRDVCAGYPGKYWRELEETGGYPDEFVRTLTELGWLSTLIPEEFGGGGLGITEAAIILEEIHRSGGAHHSPGFRRNEGSLGYGGRREAHVRYFGLRGAHPETRKHDPGTPSGIGICGF